MASKLPSLPGGYARFREGLIQDAYSCKVLERIRLSAITAGENTLPLWKPFSSGCGSTGQLVLGGKRLTHS